MRRRIDVEKGTYALVSSLRRYARTVHAGFRRLALDDPRRPAAAAHCSTISKLTRLALEWASEQGRVARIEHRRATTAAHARVRSGARRPARARSRSSRRAHRVAARRAVAGGDASGPAPAPAQPDLTNACGSVFLPPVIMPTGVPLAVAARVRPFRDSPTRTFGASACARRHSPVPSFCRGANRICRSQRRPSFLRVVDPARRRIVAGQESPRLVVAALSQSLRSDHV